MAGPDRGGADFLSALTAEELAALRAAGRSRRFAKGQPLFYEGDDPGGVIAIVRGRVKVSVTGIGGREVVLRFTSAGELIGELAAMAQRPRLATVTATEDVDAIAVRAPDFQRFLAAHPRVAPLVFGRVAALLAEADRQVVDLATRDVTARLAGRLLELAEMGEPGAPEMGEPGAQGIRLTLALSQDELAAWAGASRESVAKSLALLRRLGWVQTRRREITITDLDGLRGLVE